MQSTKEVDASFSPTTCHDPRDPRSTCFLVASFIGSLSVDQLAVFCCTIYSIIYGLLSLLCGSNSPSLAMPRGRPSSAAKSTPLKRALSPQAKTLISPSRQSKRLKSSPVPSSANKTTPKKSQFFKHESTASAPESEIEDEASGYEDEDASASAISSPPESEIEEDDDYVSAEEEDRNVKRRRKSSGKGDVGKKAPSNGIAATAKAIVEKGKELWRPGVKTDLAPGEQLFIKLPKARGDGGIKYEDGLIHPNTLLFLGDLKENNDREWLKSTI